MSKKHKVRIIFIVLLITWGGVAYGLAPSTNPIIQPLLHKASGIQLIKNFAIEGTPFGLDKKQQAGVTNFDSTIHPILDVSSTIKQEAIFTGEPESIFIVAQNSSLGGKTFIGNDPYYEDQVAPADLTLLPTKGLDEDSELFGDITSPNPNVGTFQQNPQKLNIGGDLLISSLASPQANARVCSDHTGKFVLCP